MGLIGSIKGLPVLLLVAFVLLIVANLFNWVAFSTTGWSHTFTYILNTDTVDPGRTYTSNGLWRACSATLTEYKLGAFDSCSDIYTGTAQDWFAAVQAMACFGLAGMVLSLLLVIGYLLGKDSGDFILVAGIICVATGALYLIGIIIYAAEVNEFIIVHPAGLRLGWSFGFAVVAVLLEIVAGILFIVGKKGVGTSPA